MSLQEEGGEQKNKKNASQNSPTPLWELPLGDNLESTWAQVGPSCLQKEILGDLEAISRPLEACEARDPKFFENSDGI